MKRLKAYGPRLTLAVLLTGSVATALGGYYAAPEELYSAGYADSGEAIIHGLRSRAPFVTFRMPLATVVSARLENHSPLSPAAVAALHVGLLVLLVFSLGALLHPLGGWFALPAVAGLLQDARNFNYYPDVGYTLIVLLAACVLAWRARAPTPARSAALALALGMTMLWRSPLAFFPPLLALWEWGFQHRFALKPYRKHLAILCVGPYLLLLPWLALNWSVHRQFIPFEQGAASLNIATGALGLVENTEGDLATLVGPSTDPRRNSLVLSWAARQIAEHPLRFASAIPRRAAYALSEHPLLALLALAALILFRRRREFQATGLLAAYYLAIHCLMTVEHRYFWPLWPLLATLAASLIAWRPRPGGAADSPDARLASSITLAALAAVAAAVFYVEVAVAALAFRAPRSEAEELRVALAAHPGDVWLRRQHGNERLARGDAAAAAEDFAAAARRQPGDPKHLLQLARARLLLGRPAAILGWRQPRDEGHVDYELRYDVKILRACAWIQRGREQAARELLADALEGYLERNAVVRGSQGELGRAVQSRLRTSDTGFIAHCRELQGARPASERAALRRALSALFPGSPPVTDPVADLLERAAAAARRGDRSGAADALARLEPLAPDLEERRAAAGLYKKIGDRSAAQALLDGIADAERRGADR